MTEPQLRNRGGIAAHHELVGFVRRAVVESAGAHDDHSARVGIHRPETTIGHGVNATIAGIAVLSVPLR